jgi:hypothetical protein
MAALDLRPLSLGEILDRSFSLYRENFWLFVGIVAIPHLFTLAFQMLQLAVEKTPASVQSLSRLSSGLTITGVIGVLIGVVVWIVVALYSHGATVYAVSDLYLGRGATIVDSFKRMRGHAANLFVVGLLQGLAVFAGLVLLIIPGIYVACRLSVSVPSALLEDLGPSEALSRSFALTQDKALRPFAIFCLYLLIVFGISSLLQTPFVILIALAARSGNAAMVTVWAAFSQVAGFFVTVLVTPVITIALAVFYYDLRVRREGFDLQMMMNTVPLASAAAATGLPPAPIS